MACMEGGHNMIHDELLLAPDPRYVVEEVSDDSEKEETSTTAGSGRIAPLNAWGPGNNSNSKHGQHLEQNRRAHGSTTSTGSTSDPCAVVTTSSALSTPTGTRGVPQVFAKPRLSKMSQGGDFERRGSVAQTVDKLVSSQESEMTRQQKSAEEYKRKLKQRGEEIAFKGQGFSVKTMTCVKSLDPYLDAKRTSHVVQLSSSLDDALAMVTKMSTDRKSMTSKMSSKNSMMGKISSQNVTASQKARQLQRSFTNESEMDHIHSVPEEDPDCDLLPERPHGDKEKRGVASLGWKGFFLNLGGSKRGFGGSKRDNNRNSTNSRSSHHSIVEIRQSLAKKLNAKSLQDTVMGSLERKWNFTQAVGEELIRQRFDYFMGVVILTNCILIGLEASCHPGTSCGDSTEGSQFKVALEVAEHIFLCIYLLELMLRFYVFGLRASCSSYWVRFDCFLVFTGILSTWILKPLFSDGSGKSILVLKVLRIIRLVRACRLLVQFRELWILVRGLLSSGLIMFWAITLIFVLMFVFAVVGIEIVGTNDELLAHEDTAWIAKERFGTLWETILTLASFWLLDNHFSIYAPILQRTPYLVLYFLAFIIIVSVSCMNLVTAIMVQNAINSAQQDKEATEAWEQQRRAELVPKLIGIFQKLDSDGSGDITKDELEDTTPEVADILSKIGNVDDLSDLFDVLDVDGSGSLEIDEFCAGMLKQSSEPDKPVEFLRMAKQLDKLLRMMNEILYHMDNNQQAAMNEEALNEGTLRTVQALAGHHLSADMEETVRSNIAAHDQHEHPVASQPSWQSSDSAKKSKPLSLFGAVSSKMAAFSAVSKTKSMKLFKLGRSSGGTKDVKKDSLNISRSSVGSEESDRSALTKSGTGENLQNEIDQKKPEQSLTTKTSFDEKGTSFANNVCFDVGGANDNEKKSGASETANDNEKKSGSKSQQFKRKRSLKPGSAEYLANLQASLEDRDKQPKQDRFDQYLPPAGSSRRISPGSASSAAKRSPTRSKTMGSTATSATEPDSSQPAPAVRFTTTGVNDSEGVEKTSIAIPIQVATSPSCSTGPPPHSPGPKLTSDMLERIVAEVASSIEKGPLARLESRFTRTEERIGLLEAKAVSLVAAANRQKRRQRPQEEPPLRALEAETGGSGETGGCGETGGSFDPPSPQTEYVTV